jgi:hypothetical protein
MRPIDRLVSCLWALGLGAAAGLPAQEPPAPVEQALVLADLQLRLDTTALAGFESRLSQPSGQVQFDLRGKLGASSVRVRLWALDRDAMGLREPGDVADVVLNWRRRREPSLAFASQQLTSGPFGYAAYALRALILGSGKGPPEEGDGDGPGDAPGGAAQGTVAGGDPRGAAGGEEHHLFGITERHGYDLAVECRPPLDEAGRKAVDAFFAGVKYEAPVRDHRWTDEEARRRWCEHTPEDLHDKLRIKRTKHYIILANAGADLFAKKMEECYQEIRKVYPFEEVEGQLLMPVFVFRTRDEYLDYCVSCLGVSREWAENTKGHATRDYYATYYESPNDPVHIHEATHQIFANRLQLRGGGSWFQEGVAEYVSENPTLVRSVVRNQIKDDEYIPFKRFMVLPSILLEGGSKRGGSKAESAYSQAASIIAFLAESKFGKKRFQDFVHAVGAVPRGDLKSIEGEIQRVYEVDIAGLEQRWKEHWRR